MFPQHDDHNRPAMKCERCQQVSIDTLRSAEPYHVLQPSLLALKTSADAGCDLCNLVWTCLEQSFAPATIAEQLHHGLNDEAVKLRFFRPSSLGVSMYAPQISVSVGGLTDGDRLSLHLYAGPGKNSLLVLAAGVVSLRLHFPTTLIFLVSWIPPS